MPDQGRVETTLRPVGVWDPWVRLVHWSIVVLIGLSYGSAQYGNMRLHYWSGYAVLALVLFRLAWGFLGSDTARFTRFLRSPSVAFRHLGHLARREPDREIGHNAAGGWMVLVLLALLLAQPLTGLFADSGYGDHGPLAKWVSGATSDWLTGLHHRLINWLLLAVALHLLAVLAYRLLKGQNLVLPMLTGRKVLPAEAAPPRMGSPLLALLLLGLATMLVYAISRAG